MKTTLDKSRVHGIGLFAGEFIRKGTVVWRFHPVVDIKLGEGQFCELSPPCREQMRRYTYRERMSGLYVLCGDDARFFNHSDAPNCLDEDDGAEGLTVALKDIDRGEELTCDYALFDLDMAEGRYRL